MKQLTIAIAISAALFSLNHAYAEQNLTQTSVKPSQAVSPVNSAVGSWKGAIVLPNKSELEISISFEQKDVWSGLISIPQQGAKDLKLKDLKISGNQAQFAIDGVPGSPTFNGTFTDNLQTLSGEFSQGGGKMTFKLVKDAVTKISSLDQTKAALVGFEQDVEKIRKEWNVPGIAIAIVKGDQIIYAKGHGLRDVANNLPMTADTLLPIGSSTKAFTTAVLGALVDEGKLEWDKPIRTWLPSFKLQDNVATDRMTPVDLVTHRSGLPRHEFLWYNAKLTRADTVRRLQYLEPNKDFRTDFQYNNAMFLTAGYLSEIVSGKSWEDNVKNYLFTPLGMTRSNFTVEVNQKDSNFSRPYREEKDGKIKQIPYRSITNVGPAGSINSSVNELAAWMQLHLNHGKYQGKQILSSATVDYLHKVQTPISTLNIKDNIAMIGYAPGWFSDIYRGQFRIYHGGNIDGFSALVELLPGSDLGIAILTNLNGSPATEYIARAAIDRIAALEKRDWSGEARKKKDENKAEQDKAEEKKKAAHKTNTKPSHPIGDYVGDFEHPGYGVVHVGLKDGKLLVEFNGIVTPFEHWHYDTFNGLKAEDPVFEDGKIQFTTSLEGEISAIEIELERTVKPIVFKRIADKQMNDPEFLKKFTGTFALNKDLEVVVSMRGNVLVVDVKGQPQYELIPVRGTRFSLKNLNGYSVDFKADAKGEFNSADLDQPNGIFTLKRK